MESPGSLFVSGLLVCDPDTLIDELDQLVPGPNGEPVAYFDGDFEGVFSCSEWVQGAGRCDELAAAEGVEISGLLPFIAEDSELGVYCGCTCPDEALAYVETTEQDLAPRECAEALKSAADATGASYWVTDFGVILQGLVDAPLDPAPLAEQLRCEELSVIFGLPCDALRPVALITDNPNKIQLGCQCNDHCRMLVEDPNSFSTYDAHGAGTVSEPFEIYTARQLHDLADSELAWHQHFVQCRDIDLAPHYDTESHFHVATYTLPFSGSYDGLGHAIDRFESGEQGGLFMSVTGAIHHLAMANALVTSSPEPFPPSWWRFAGTLANDARDGAELWEIQIRNADLELTGPVAVGGLVGHALNATISRVQLDGIQVRNDEEGSNGSDGGLVGYLQDSVIRYSTVRNVNLASGFCSAGFVGASRDSEFFECRVSDADVSGGENFGCAGAGFVGSGLRSLFHSCHVSSATVSTDWGGIAGFAGLLSDHSFVQDSSSFATGVGGRVLGGFVGSLNSSTIVTSQAHGSFSGGEAEYIWSLGGGFVGSMRNDAVIQDCFTTADVVIPEVFPTNPSSLVYGGGFVGRAIAGATISRSYSSGDVSLTPPSQGDFGVGSFAGTIWQSSIQESFATGQTTGATAEDGCFTARSEDSTISNSWIQTGNAVGCVLDADVSVAPLFVFDTPNENFDFQWSTAIWLFENGSLPVLQ